tara:strand:- start:90037 stop:90282 length:246 start_codon:yes stop_codon:yes gene_type:complete
MLSRVRSSSNRCSAEGTNQWPPDEGSIEKQHECAMVVIPNRKYKRIVAGFADSVVLRVAGSYATWKQFYVSIPDSGVYRKS